MHRNNLHMCFDGKYKRKINRWLTDFSLFLTVCAIKYWEMFSVPEMAFCAVYWISRYRSSVNRIQLGRITTEKKLAVFIAFSTKCAFYTTSSTGAVLSKLARIRHNRSIVVDPQLLLFRAVLCNLWYFWAITLIKLIFFTVVFPFGTNAIQND